MTRLLTSVLSLALAGFGVASCAGPKTPGETPPALPDRPGSSQLWPSPRLVIGRIVACDEARGFAFVELQADAPAEASRAETELLVRTTDLTPTATLRASTQLRGRLLGCTVVAGRPGVGEEVVWLAP